jgi:type VI secretion system protein ImpF
LLERDALVESIRREVSNLLNTRCAWPIGELDRGSRTILDYGLPDLSNYHTTNPEDYALVERAVRETIEAYEPRLDQVQVELAAVDRRMNVLTLRVGGKLRMDGIVEPVSFRVSIGDRAGAAEQEYPRGAAGA